jgi:hypothetical protein
MLRKSQLRAWNNTASEKGTVPFFLADSEKSGQSPAVLFHALGLAICVGLVIAAAGCSKSSPDETADGGVPASQAAAVPSDPAARVVHEFLGAVLKADDQRINACLTPLAVQRLTESNKRFPTFGADTTKFQIGEIRKLTETQAFVQCWLTDVSPDGKTLNDEICCVVRLVDKQWRVCGMAFGAAEGRPPVFDFESPPQPMTTPATAVPADMPSQDVTAPTQNASAPAPSRPSPPRTATETPNLYNR